MELHLKINDVIGMDEQKRHIIHVDDESIREALFAKPKWLAQEIIKSFLLKYKPGLLSEIIDDPQVRNTIFMQEQAKRTEKSERRERHRQFEIEKKRREEAHKASIATRKALNFYHDILGIEDDEEES